MSWKKEPVLLFINMYTSEAPHSPARRHKEHYIAVPDRE